MVVGSGVAATLIYDPGVDAAERFPDWVIRHKPLRGLHEVLCRRRRVILLDDERDSAKRRCRLAHAIAHLDLRHGSVKGVLDARQELAADRLAAKRLLDIRMTGEALAWAESVQEAALELDVERHILELRLQCLHPSERAYLRKRLELGEP